MTETIAQCNECGVVVANPDLHRQHCFAMPMEPQIDAQALVLSFLEAVDASELERGILERCDGFGGEEFATGEAALAYLRDQVKVLA
jgi:hypothetical protein